jgi:hypothetical protein
MPLNKFVPLSPDPYITSDPEMTLAKFGHLNTIVDYLNAYVAVDSLQLAGSGPITSTARYISDSTGVNSAISISTIGVGIGTNTLLGILHLKSTAATTRMVMDGDAGQSKIITYRTAGLQRFGLYVNNTAESGSNAGSNFAIRAYSDAGTLLNTPLFIERSTGNVGINSTTPAYKLEVQGNGLFRTTTTSTPLVVAHSGGTAIQIENNATGNRLQLSTLSTYVAISTPDTYLTINPNGPKTNVGTSSNLNATLGIKGSGSTSATISLLVQNSGGTVTPLKTTDDGTAYIGWDSTGDFNGIFYANGNVGIGRYSKFIEGRNNAGSEVRISSQTWNFTTSTFYSTNLSLTPAGVLNLGSYSGAASSILTMTSTTQGFLPPRMTTAQKNLIATPATGLQVHDTDLNRPCFYNGTSWVTL